MIYTVLAIVAAGLMLWPKQAKPAPGLFAPPPAPPPPASDLPSFLEATAALAGVRRRLAGTEQLDAEQRQAIDCLQLALTAGSDAP